MCSTVNSEHRVNWERSRRWRVTDRPLRFATELQSFRHLPSECVRWSVWRRFKINERPDALQTQTKNTSDFFANALWVFTAFLTVRKATYHCRRVGLIVGCLSLRIGHDGRNPALASVAPGDWVNGRLDIKNIWVNRATWARCAPIVPRHKQPRQRLNRICSWRGYHSVWPPTSVTRPMREGHKNSGYDIPQLLAFSPTCRKTSVGAQHVM